MLNILVQKLHFSPQNIGRKIRKNIFLFLIFIPLEAGDPPASTEPILVKIFYRLPIFRGMFCWGKCPFQNQRYFGIVTLECSKPKTKITKLQFFFKIINPKRSLGVWRKESFNFYCNYSNLYIGSATLVHHALHGEFHNSIDNIIVVPVQIIYKN